MLLFRLQDSKGVLFFDSFYQAAGQVRPMFLVALLTFTWWDSKGGLVRTLILCHKMETVCEFVFPYSLL